MSNKRQNQPNYKELLLNAINPANEKKISKAYKVFHNYSITNQFLAMQQMDEISPISTFKKWSDMGRKVKKGSKAIALYMPINIKEKDENGKETGEEKTFFILKRNWFSFDQTQTEGDNQEIEAIQVNEWNQQKALEALDIKKIKFEKVNGNTQGYAFSRNIAINPIAENPLKTAVHEMAHIILGHTAETENEYIQNLTKEQREVEAESVAFIFCAVNECSDLANSRGYIQHYLKNNELDEKSAKRIFTTANKIIKAGV